MAMQVDAPDEECFVGAVGAKARAMFELAELARTGPFTVPAFAVVDVPTFVSSSSLDDAADLATTPDEGPTFGREDAALAGRMEAHLAADVSEAVMAAACGLGAMVRIGSSLEICDGAAPAGLPRIWSEAGVNRGAMSAAEPSALRAATIRCLAGAVRPYSRWYLQRRGLEVAGEVFGSVIVTERVAASLAGVAWLVDGAATLDLFDVDRGYGQLVGAEALGLHQLDEDAGWARLGRFGPPVQDALRCLADAAPHSPLEVELWVEGEHVVVTQMRRLATSALLSRGSVDECTPIDTTTLSFAGCTDVLSGLDARQVADRLWIAWDEAWAGVDAFGLMCLADHVRKPIRRVVLVRHPGAARSHLVTALVEDPNVSFVASVESTQLPEVRALTSNDAVWTDGLACEIRHGLGRASASDTAGRKEDHLRLAAGDSCRSTGSTGLEAWGIAHRALPAMDFGDVDLSTAVVDRELKWPLLISSMTGGSRNGGLVNRRLARVAQARGIALSLGSLRALLECRDAIDSYDVRPLAPTIPLFGNIGTVDVDVDRLVSMCELLSLDALYVHLNPLQEAFQPEGCASFRDTIAVIERIVATAPIPVWVKEVGFGLCADDVRALVDVGVRGIDVAGAGGTNWAAVEAHRFEGGQELVAPFRDWGWPTADTLSHAVGVRHSQGAPFTIVASGGIADGVDAVKSLCLGADLVGIAGTVLRSAIASATALAARLDVFIEQMRIAAFGAGAARLGELDRSRLRRVAPGPSW